jgi:hypothetical protein
MQKASLLNLVKAWNRRCSSNIAIKESKHFVLRFPNRRLLSLRALCARILRNRRISFGHRRLLSLRTLCARVLKNRRMSFGHRRLLSLRALCARESIKKHF